MREPAQAGRIFIERAEYIFLRRAEGLLIARAVLAERVRKVFEHAIERFGEADQ